MNDNDDCELCGCTEFAMTHYIDTPAQREMADALTAEFNDDLDAIIRTIAFNVETYDVEDGDVVALLRHFNALLQQRNDARVNVTR